MENALLGKILGDILEKGNNDVLKKIVSMRIFFLTIKFSYYKIVLTITKIMIFSENNIIY